MKLFKKIFSMIMAGAFVLGTSVFSTSSSDIEKYETENTSLISNEMGGGGGTPSIDEPDDEKPKVFPQPEIVETEYEDEPIDYADAVSWGTRYNEEIARRKEEDPSYAFSYSGSGTEADPYLIQDEFDFYKIRSYTTNKYFKLTNDIYLNYGKFVENEETGEIEYFSRKDMEDKVYIWNKIANLTNCTIDGDGYAIYGFYGVGLFYKYETYSLLNCIIRDLHIKNAYSIKIGAYVDCAFMATLSNYCQGCRFENISVDGWSNGEFGNSSLIARAKNSTFTRCINYMHNIGRNGNQYSAGICSYATDCTIENCTNYGNMKNTISCGAGVVYEANGSTQIINCTNYGNMNALSQGTAGICAKGGVVENCNNYGATLCGIGGSRHSKVNTISKCRNYGQCVIGIGHATEKIIDSVNNTESVFHFGHNVTKCGIGTASIIKNCVNYASYNESASLFYGIGDATIIVDCVNFGNRTGGSMSGIGSAKDSISNCVNYGDAKNSESNSAGIGQAPMISNCKNYGKLSSSRGKVGGIMHSSIDKVIINNCINFGTLSNAVPAGGIIGIVNNNHKVTIRNCENYGNFINNNRVGGIVGYISQNASVEISNCINAGDISSGIYDIGFLVGYVQNGNLILKNCINEGATIKTFHALIGSKTGTCIVEVDGIISSGMADGQSFKEYYGSDFSAFYVKWKTGEIGLKALDNVGVYMLTAPSEEYLQERGFTKIA